MNKYLLMLIASILFTGCATQAMMRSVTDPYVGKHIDSINAVMGNPVSERNIAGKKIISWNVGASGTYVLPKTETATIYGSGGYSTATITGTQTQSFNYHCRLDATVDQNFYVRSIYWEGNHGGCDMLHSRLKRGVPGGGLSFWDSITGNE